MKKRFSIALLLGTVLLSVGLSGCGSKQADTKPQEAAADIEKEDDLATAPDAIETDTEKSEDIYIVYTNDVHSYIYNTVTNEDGEEFPGLRLSNVAAMVNDMKAEGKNVLLVDAGDEIQGDVHGAFDSGESIIKLMNETGYQLATLGNHEFDYGTFTLFNRVEEANYPYITCNFHALLDDEDPFKPSHIFDIAGMKVAFIGITTPETITSSTPAYFQNEEGEYIYTIDGIADKNDLYASVQNAIDEVRDEADYVIALAHVGIGLESVKNGMSSYDIIKNVSGLDAYIDGHSHSTVEGEKVEDKDGKEVVLTQTGCYLNNVGLMKIGSDGITTSLINEYDNKIESVAAIEDETHDRIVAEMGEKIAVLNTPLYILNPDDPNTRYVRSREMNSGDFVADAAYWYFNDELKMECDVAFANGGGVRAQLESGDVTYLDVKSVQPFGNMICLIEASGQDILDALEMGVDVIGEWDEEWNAPAENGGFMQVAGMKYTVDATIPSSLKISDEGMFISVDGEYRVKDVMIYDRQTGEYKPLELDKLYKVGGINYLLRNSGNGLNMFTKCDTIVDFVDLDYMIMSEYMKSFSDNGDIKTENSPLSKLNGYLIDYENPYGAGRISIILE